MKHYLNISQLKSFDQFIENYDRILKCDNGWKYSDCLYLNVVSSDSPELILTDVGEDTRHSSEDMDRLCEEVFAGFGWSMGEFYIIRDFLPLSNDDKKKYSERIFKIADYKNKGFAKPENREKIREIYKEVKQLRLSA